MNINATLIAQIILSLLVLTGLVFWVRSLIRESYSPRTGEVSAIKFLQNYLFEVRLGKKRLPWYQRLSFYLLFWPFSRVSFTYEWSDQMTYQEYLGKKAIESMTKDYSVSIEWQPEYKDDQIENGVPKNKTVQILVTRKEKMTALHEFEAFSFVVEFETKEGWRGWRLFTMILEVEDFIVATSRFRQWQSPASLSFGGAYNAWSKTVDYPTLRRTTIDSLSLILGRSQAEPFTDEINEKVRDFGFKVRSFKDGPIYLSLGTLDMVESQELPAKEQNKLDATKLKAEGIKVEAQAKAEAIKVIQGAETEVIKDRAAIAVETAQELNKLEVASLTAKYGTEGIGKLTGVYVEGTGPTSNPVDINKVVKNILSFKIIANQNQAA